MGPKKKAARYIQGDDFHFHFHFSNDHFQRPFSKAPCERQVWDGEPAEDTEVREREGEGVPAPQSPPQGSCEPAASRSAGPPPWGETHRPSGTAVAGTAGPRGGSAQSPQPMEGMRGAKGSTLIRIPYPHN